MTSLKYKITQQYARDSEIPIAEFSALNDAIFFVERKCIADSEKLITIIYRIFVEQKLFKEFNKEKINCSIRIAQYATSELDLPLSIGSFKVSKDTQYNTIAAFIDFNDAELFVEDRLTHSEDEITYYIFNGTTLITKMDKHIKRGFLKEDDKQETKGKATSFRPTPLSTTPRPPGTPPAWIKDNEDEDNENK